MHQLSICDYCTSGPQAHPNSLVRVMGESKIQWNPNKVLSILPSLYASCQQIPFFRNGTSMAAYGSVLNASTAQQATIDKDYSDANIYVEFLKAIFPYLQIKGNLKV